MDRRKFLKLSALTGLALSAPLGLGLRRVRAGALTYGGPFYVFVNAGGAWDPRFLCDPILDPAQNRVYGSIATAGNIPYAPIAMTDATTGLDPASAGELLGTQAFFEKYAAQLLCINGIDMATNNHDGGVRHIWSGKLEEGHPSIGALVAATKAPAEALAYISSGGYDQTQGLVPLTRMSSIDTIRRVAYPHHLDPADLSAGTYHTGDTIGRIRAAQTARAERLQSGATLPRDRAAKSELLLARENDDTLQALVLPDALVDFGDYNLSDLERFMQQAQLALAAFQAGLAAAVNLNLGGFDTHATHDRDQVRQIGKLLRGVDFLMTEAQNMGLGGQLTVMIGSDFARGPFYNGDNEFSGKDHWSIGSAMFMGNGIAGNRVVGATDDDQRAVPYNGTVITPAHIHQSLRNLAAVSADPKAAEYPLPGEDLGLFG